MPESAVNLLLNKWQAEPGLSLRNPVPLAELEVFEVKFAVKLPDELRDYFLEVDGFGPGSDQDENGFSFWPLARVSPLKDFERGEWFVPGLENCFVFADYLTLSWAYACRLTPDAAVAPVCIVGTADRQPQWIAKTFQQFAELYVADSEKVYVNSKDR